MRASSAAVMPLKARLPMAPRRHLRRVPNAEYIRRRVREWLEAEGKPMSLHVLAGKLRHIMKYKIRTEYLLMELLMKQRTSGIVFLDDMHFGLAEWYASKK